MRVTACIILRSMFGMDISKDRLRALEGDVEDMIRFVNDREALPLKPPLWVPLPSIRRYREARARVHALIREVIARRRAEPHATPSRVFKASEGPDERPGSVLGRLLTTVAGDAPDIGPFATPVPKTHERDPPGLPGLTAMARPRPWAARGPGSRSRAARQE